VAIVTPMAFSPSASGSVSAHRPPDAVSAVSPAARTREPGGAEPAIGQSSRSPSARGTPRPRGSTVPSLPTSGESATGRSTWAAPRVVSSKPRVTPSPSAETAWAP
jgi:hypothetical protein